MGNSPSQSVATPSTAASSAATDTLLATRLAFFNQLWQASDASEYDMPFVEFAEILLAFGIAQNYNLPSGQDSPAAPTLDEEIAFFHGLRISDLVLAHACANGNDRAWEHFLHLYQQPLTRAAIAITHSDSQGRDLADALYADLYGLTTRDGTPEGERRCPLSSYKGRGSLIGWLRTTLAQRHVDHYRRTWREIPLDEDSAGNEPPAPAAQSTPASEELNLLSHAMEAALLQLTAEDKFLIASYYLDGQTLLQIGRMLQVHEATISRKLHRTTDGLRKQLLRNLQKSGLSKRAAQEALGADPRDLDMNLKKLLQFSQTDAFPEKAGL